MQEKPNLNDVSGSVSDCNLAMLLFLSVDISVVSFFGLETVSPLRLTVVKSVVSR